MAPDTWPIGLGYEPWVEEVWANLLSNALKYAGRPVSIELGGELQPDGLVCFWIRDNGSGIAPADQARLFEAFYRVHTNQSNGHGLGLAIVKRIVERLGGEVSVQSSGVRVRAASSVSPCRRRDRACGSPRHEVVLY